MSKIDYGTMADEMRNLSSKRIGYCALCFSSVYTDDEYTVDDKRFIYCKKCNETRGEIKNAV